MSDLPVFSQYDGHFVSPRLALGGCPKPEHVADLGQAGIRGVINLVGCCGPTSMAYVPMLPENIHWLHLAMWDGWLGRGQKGYHEMLSAGYARFLVQRAAMVMRDCSPVLVHCMSGVGRSGNVAILLLAASEGITIDEAVDHIRSHRPQISGFAPDAYWKHAGAEELLAMARQVLHEKLTPQALVAQRVFDGL